MKFTLNADGMAPVQQGIGNIFKALVQAPILQEQMQQQASLRNAQAYSANMTGNKHGAEAAGLQYTVDQRKGIEDLIAKNPQFAQNVQSALKLWAATGKGDPNNIANAATEFQTQGIRDKAVSNVGDLEQMNRLNTLAKPGQTYEPFANIGNTGTVFNKATGAGTVASNTLAKLYGNESQSKTAENFAQAGQAGAGAALSNERIKALQLGDASEGVDENGNQVVYRVGTTGNVEILPKVKPLVKAGGKDAALAKARAQVVAAVAKDFAVKPEDREAEVERRMALIEGREPDLPAPAPKKPGLLDRLFGVEKSADAAPSSSKMSAPSAGVKQSAESIRAAYKAGKVTREEAKKQLKAIGFD
jgi:hypothetical protein